MKYSIVRICLKNNHVETQAKLKNIANGVKKWNTNISGTTFI